MDKNWSYEFAQVHQGLGKIEKAAKESKELRKDPAAYMQKLR